MTKAAADAETAWLQRL